MLVMPRLVWPSWRWVTMSGTPLACHLDGVGVAELVRREAPAHASRRGGLAELCAGGGCRPGAPAGRSAQDAEQRSDGQCDADLEPWLELFPGPVVHADLATAPALAAAHEQRAAARVEVGLAERQRLVDA